MRRYLLGNSLENTLQALAFDQRKQLLACLGAADNSSISARKVAVVVAHPDDEAVGIAGQLHRLKGATTVHITDGAPHDLEFARHHGFETREAYAQARRDELASAMALAGVPSENQIGLGVADQQVAKNLYETTMKLRQLFVERGIEVVLTHPYEGGHPDHDSTAFCVHLACELIERACERRPDIIEMASYFEGEDGAVYQRFIEDASTGETVARLTPEQSALKASIFGAHKTQVCCLKVFHYKEERFRSAPAYNFAELPNNGKLHYNTFRSGMTAARWRGLVAEAIGQLQSKSIAA